MNKSVKEWYVSEFPLDEMGAGIYDDITFGGVLECLRDGYSVYEYIGVADSLVRERIFAKLASLRGVSGDYIYRLWLHSASC